MLVRLLQLLQLSLVVLFLLSVAVPVVDAALFVADHVDAVFAAVFPALAATGFVMGHSSGEEGLPSSVPFSQPLSKHRGS